jgi:nitrite reductase/ring-hydroxylating ferredoxin subunit
MAKRRKTLRAPFSGYHRYRGSPDLDLVQVGPDTPGGEYLRRFWHPIELASNVKDRPIPLRVLGEELVLFRDLSGHLGLLERHCSHRGAGLDLGRITERGIQCCYHGWHYAVDGTIIETPVDGAHCSVIGKVFHGAYPVREVGGLIFAYMGPPAEMPDFSHFDFFNEPTGGRVFYKRHSPCNWIQVRDNEVDNAHGSFLHTVMAGDQLTSAYHEIANIEIWDTPIGLVGTQTRRVGEHVFVRVNEVILPNICRVACIEDGEGETVYDRRGPIVNWCVPADDVNCFVIGFNAIGPGLPDAKRNAFMDREVRAGRDPYTHPQLNFEFGQDGQRPYEERQQVPGDWDAWVSQGPINIHANEHLVPNDEGVVRYRGLLKEGIRAVEAGKTPKGVVKRVNGSIETYASNTVIRVPKAATPKEDAELIHKVSREIIAKTLDGRYRRENGEARP